MLGCFLHISGKDFDPHAFLPEAQLQPTQFWQNSDPRSISRPSEKHDVGGATFEVTREADELSGQLEVALAFLTRYRHDLERLARDETVENRLLDFSIVSRLNQKKHIQFEMFPLELLEQVVPLKIAVSISIQHLR